MWLVGDLCFWGGECGAQSNEMKMDFHCDLNISMIELMDRYLISSGK